MMPPNRNSLASPQPNFPSGVALALLVAVYLLPGLVGHDPWRGDDVRSFSVVLGMLNGENWLFPHVAGEPSTVFPPLYYWVSTLFALAFGWLLPLHDAARLATGLFAALTILWIARSAERLYGKSARTTAGLLTIGTLGLAIHAHEMQPMIALLAMQALTLAGLAKMAEDPLRGGAQAALGTALAFLAAGPIGLLLTIPLFLLLALACPECRTPRASGALTLSLSLALGACAIWPVLLGQKYPELVTLWWSDAIAVLGGPNARNDNLLDMVELLGWFLWPLWPIALWALWRNRRALIRMPILLPLGSIVMATGVLYAVGEFHHARVLPLIPGFALLAAVGVQSLRRGAANAFDWFALMTFAVFAVLVWLAWTAQALQWPPGLARSLARSAPDFVLAWSFTQIALGVSITVGWLVLVSRMPRAVNRGPTNWAMGTTMLWCLAVTLLLPWFNHDRSYRAVSASLAIALAGEPPGCVASIGLTSSHRAALDYFANLRTEAVSDNETGCPYLLVRVDGRSGIEPAAPWQQIWEDRHAGGRRLELFRLYRRE